MRRCKDVGIKPAWLGVDRTGNGTGVHDALRRMFGEEVYGIMFSWAATDTMILEDDTETCAERYYDIITEMAFATRRLIEVHALKLHPGINWNDLERQTVPRRYFQVGRGILRLEDKKTFKKRNGGLSPDRFDSLIITTQVSRVNGGVTGAMVTNPVQKSLTRDRVSHGIVDVMEFMDMSN
jgi:hypothetical protein